VPIQVYDARLSFIWVEILPQLLSGAPPNGAPLGFLADRVTYEQRFGEAVREAPLGQGELHAPWRHTGKHFFWTYYLGGRRRAEVSGAPAWKALVPFRAAQPARVQANWWPGRLWSEAYFYPFGMALVVSAHFEGDLTLDDWLAKVFELRRSGRLQLEPAGGEAEVMSLDMLADRGLAALREAALGTEARAGARPVLPFSVVTVVRGAGADPTLSPDDGGEIQRALEALVRWSPTYAYDQLPPLDERRLTIRRGPAGHLLYGHDRGRATWFPAHFLRPASQGSSLGCYHRNLTYLSLQVESLGELARQCARDLEAGRAFSAHQRACAQRAAALLGLLYAGHRDTYRSWSPRPHLDQNELVPDVNRVRAFFTMEPLH
jgi:hypothetical protein